MNTFFDCLFEKKLVRDESLKQMTTVTDNFGLGLIQVPFYDMKGYGYTGGIDGFQATTFYFTTEKVSIALTSNGVAYPLNDIILGVLSTYFGKEWQLPQM
ncbi:hypothetical protein [Bacteroides sp. 51]|uniref:hypothetical protein n=1 Tax=Bacteroides sp. 51 TaxID=2302938 RepID=UPI0013D5A07B|nr:hypothetical protein [Bacteroides sp. 51]